MNHNRWSARLAGFLIPTLALLLGLLPQTALPARSATAVFINEIHYDNAGTDTGEAIEIAGPAGTDLTGWSIVRYNGANGQLYTSPAANPAGSDTLSGTIPDLCAGFGVVVVNYAVNGLQNGAPDGLALVDNLGTVVQFLSYEGTFAAVDGPANGLTSTDIGVSEADTTAVGDSLQLGGAGTMYEDFTWSSPSPATFGAANEGQTFSGCTPDPTPTPTPTPVPTAGELVLNEIDYDQPSTDTAEFIEIKNNDDDSVNLDAFSLDLVNGNGTVVYRSIDLPAVDLAAGDYYVVCSNASTVANCDLDLTPDTDLVQNGAPDAVALLFNGQLIDTVSYEGDTGAPYTEGSGTGLTDTAAGADGISRCPDGTDTNVNNVDFSLRAITPGLANNCPPPPPPAGLCGSPATFIHDIQGSTLTSPVAGAPHVIEGVVVGDYQDTITQFRGFYLQEEDGQADADPATSEGIFVFDNGFGVDVNPGDVVRVLGTVSEFSSGSSLLTEVGSVTHVAVCSSGNSVTPSSVTLPVASVNDFEQFEGMLINISQDLTVTENFTLGRFGEVHLSVNGRLPNPTNIVAPGPPAIAQQDLNNRSRILLDDGNNQQNIDPTFYPAPGLSAANTLRSGYTVNGLTGVLDQRFSAYRLQPVGPVSFNANNPRTTAPDSVGGTVKVASFNVLNYFTTIDTGAAMCGPANNQDCRGADSPSEFTRQRDKIISALRTIDPDIAGLIELENNPSTSLQDLVDGLNALAGPGTYNFIDTGVIGSDAIKVGFIYKPGSVNPVGPFAILDSSVDPTFIDTLNRPALAQTFEQTATGARFTAVINHLKSKGSDCNAVGDPDTGDGQGNCNQTRRTAAIALVNWLATDPTGSGDPDVLIIGDLNSYALEDPITAIKSAGYTDQINAFIGAGAYSFVFEGQSGYLDHALSNPGLSPQVAGGTEWHINADEPIALDYNEEFKTANQLNTFYAPDAYRASDHDPVLVGLNLTPQCKGQNATIYVGADGKIVGGPLNGRVFNGILSGTLQDDVIVGTGGDDLIAGLRGADLICGGSGHDTLLGELGDDTLNGDEGDDYLDGGIGADTLDGGRGHDILNGRAGDDHLAGGDGNDDLDGGVGDDTLDGGADNDTLVGLLGDDTLNGGPGDDTLNGGLGQNDSCDGGDGTDTATKCETVSNVP